MCSGAPEKSPKAQRKDGTENERERAKAATAVACMGVSAPMQVIGALGILWPQGDSRVGRELELTALPVATTLKGYVLGEGKN